jgi:hypothetical protein
MIILAIQLINNVNRGVKGNHLDKSTIFADVLQMFPCYPLVNG